MPPRHEQKKMHFPIIAPSSLRVVSRASASGGTPLRNSSPRHQSAATAPSAATLPPQRRLAATLLPQRRLAATLLPQRRLAATQLPQRRLAATLLLWRLPGRHPTDAALPPLDSAAAVPQLLQPHTAATRLSCDRAAAIPLAPHHRGASALSCDAKDMRIAPLSRTGTEWDNTQIDSAIEHQPPTAAESR